MSGVASAIGSIFTAVVDTVVSVGSSIIGAAASIFTGGAATGLGGAVSGLAGGLNLGGSLGGIISGALTSGLVGAAVGAGTALITGGDIGTGALYGGLGGAALGGLGAGLSNVTGVPDAAVMPTGSTTSAVAGGAVPTAATASQLPSVVAPSASSGGSGGILSGLFGDEGFLSRNGEWLGPAIAGVGEALLGGDEQQAQIDALMARDEAARDAIRQNYSGVGPGLLSLADAPIDTTMRPTPAERWDPRTYGGKWEYDTQTGKLEYRENGHGGGGQPQTQAA